ncbi:hypothetical protein I302_103244 [Kwoniella bestiolae CBS 10118]|uniref:PX domain-containing protein n=1 Tax=Kwoniella bestiolae CBS 10118 TaxID=1296100 RepID=A0A1B9G7W1_9TREE|nr:hypothetical protein I302_01943 [Kwoniella bestiolae CBS 10118]OCF27108.1 hypothetical protein I302_01943 [Kwoniella bestiolae CBS 10118]
MDDPLSPHNINPSWSDTPTPTSSNYSNQILSPSHESSSTSASGDYSREPKVFGAPGLGLVSPPPSSTSTDGPSSTMPSGETKREREREPPGLFLRVRIGGLERNRKDLLIRFDASTNLPNFRTSLYRNMQRSYVEFQRFAEQAQLCCPQTIIPALPLPSTSAVTDEEDDRLVRIALQRWFTRICEDPVLMKDDELRSFIESDFGYTPVPPPSARKSSAASAATGVFSAALSKVVRRGPLDEDDELQSAKNALDKLEERWGAAATAINGIGKARRAYAVSNADVGAKLISLSTVESDPQLAAAERKVGRTWEHLSGMIGAQAASENVILSDSLGYQALNARAAKDALLQRTTLLEDSQTATKSAINKRRNVERLKGSSKIDPVKVDDALHEMEEANTLETSLSNRLNAISQNLHLSIRTHSRHAHEDVAVALLEAARMSVMYHKQHLRELEALKPDLNKIGTSAPVPASTSKVAGGTPKQGNIGLPPQVTPQARRPPQLQPQSQPQVQPPMAHMSQGFAPVPPNPPGPTRQPQPPSGLPHPPHPGLQASYNQQSQSPRGQPAYPQFAPQGPSYAQNQQPQQGILPPQQQAGFPQQNQPYPQQGYAPVFRGYPTRPPPPAGQGYNHMNGTQSMFLPPPGPQSAGPVPGPDPLNSGVMGMNNGAGTMSQSMMLPHHGRPHTPGSGGPATMGRQGSRRLDERQAARMLAGGF